MYIIWLVFIILFSACNCNNEETTPQYVLPRGPSSPDLIVYETGSLIYIDFSLWSGGGKIVWISNTNIWKIEEKSSGFWGYPYIVVNDKMFFISSNIVIVSNMNTQTIPVFNSFSQLSDWALYGNLDVRNENEIYLAKGNAVGKYDPPRGDKNQGF